MGIASGVTTQPAASYKMRMEEVVVDLCTCHRQGLAVLAVLAVMVQQQRHC